MGCCRLSKQMFVFSSFMVFLVDLTSNEVARVFVYDGCLHSCQFMYHDIETRVNNYTFKQVKFFSSEDCPSIVGLKSTDHLQARTSSMLHPYTVESNDCPPGFDVNLLRNQLTDLSCIPLIKWNCPPKVSTIRYFSQMPIRFRGYMMMYVLFSVSQFSCVLASFF